MKVPQQAAVVSLGGFFSNEDDSEGEETGVFENETEITEMEIAGVKLAVRQMAWHCANANQVWPGTFNLADHILKSKDVDGKSRYQSGKVLELGSATGALAIALMKLGDFDITTCDIDDGGEVEENINWNCLHNGISSPLHIAHTWGTEWLDSSLDIKFIIASDILLYVSAYPALVESLVKIFSKEMRLVEFLMSWNRRINESSIFFDLMDKAGFQCHSYGHGLYSFYRLDNMDDYLHHLSQ